jgi:hypothetical protein
MSLLPAISRQFITAPPYTFDLKTVVNDAPVGRYVLSECLMQAIAETDYNLLELVKMFWYTTNEY